MLAVAVFLGIVVGGALVAAAGVGLMLLLDVLSDVERRQPRSAR